MKKSELCFRLLMELYSFLLRDENTLLRKSAREFPSPYGVIFILTHILKKQLCKIKMNLFPSPYGVIFILTLWSKKSSIAIYF